MNNKIELDEININLPINVDKVILAKGTEFEVEVTRYLFHPNISNALVFSALIEEILQLKCRINELENKK